MTWIMEILKIWQEEQLQTNFEEIKHLVLLKTQNIMDIKEVLLVWFIIFLIKKTSGSSVKIIQNEQLT